MRSSGCVLVVLLAVTLFGYFYQGRVEGKWWDSSYILSLAIPLTIIPLAIWAMFVPRHLEYSDTHLVIRTLLEGHHTLSWSELKHYGTGRNVFMIQFDSVPTFQIFPQAYPRAERRKFVAFLEATFPEKQASGFMGPWMFK